MLRREIKRVKRRESDAWRKRLRYEVSNIDDENIVCECVYRFDVGEEANPRGFGLNQEYVCFLVGV